MPYKLILEIIVTSRNQYTVELENQIAVFNSAVTAIERQHKVKLPKLKIQLPKVIKADAKQVMFNNYCTDLSKEKLGDGNVDWAREMKFIKLLGARINYNFDSAKQTFLELYERNKLLSWMNVYYKIKDGGNANADPDTFQRVKPDIDDLRRG